MTSVPSSPARSLLGVGIVGLSASGGWAGRAHVPALAAVDGLELRAVAASSAGSARAAADKYGVPSSFGSVEELVGDDQVDLVVVAVKVPAHRELVLAAAAAGKAVLCEWPLARDVAEAEELVAAAQGVRSFVGLQARSAGAVRYLADLIADGYVGEVLSSSTVGSGGAWGPQVDSRSQYLLDRDNGATMLSIPFGHTIDGLGMVLGEFTELSATTAVRRGEVTNSDTGQVLAMTAEDQVVVHGVLANGAVASVHYRGGRSRGTNFIWEINGADGDLLVTGDSGHLQYGQVTIRGARAGDTTMAELAIPPAYDLVPALAGQPGHAVAHAYTHILADLTEGTETTPDFAHALRRHRMLDRIQQAAASGTRVQVAVERG
jgi:predicted dehydrogenase